MKVFVVFGTRPEAIKMCPLVLELKKHKEMECVVCLTGQHREMLKQVMDAFAIEADINLDIMKDRQDLFDITCNILQRINIQNFSLTGLNLWLMLKWVLN